MTVRFSHIASLLALIAVGAIATGSTAAASSVPTGLHGFLLRADEPATTPPETFHRTPSFAWDPYPGATGYQFQLSMSSTFRENAIFYNTNTLTTPVAAPSIVLPWITGSPYSLYARVRATLSSGDVTPWSDDYGFAMTAPDPATPLASDPGLLRWTPVDGATSYQVWLVDVPKHGQAFALGKETTTTNVLDEREFYTFHQSSNWISTVRWRVRAVRSLEAGQPANGLPATSFGAWSPVYKSANPPLSANVPSITNGVITPLHTISDVTSVGSPENPGRAHRLMTGFTWTGNKTADGATAELFRVYVFTDKQCLNRVYTSAVVGSPAYGPRTGAPLGLPQDFSGIATARSGYLDDGSEGPGAMLDGTPVTANEAVSAAAPTTTAPADDGPAGSDSSAATGAAAAASGAPAAPPATGAPAAGPGAPIDLWDTDSWPKGGYYWIVVGVAAQAADASGASTVSAPGASQTSTLVPVSDTTQFVVGKSVTIGVAPKSDTATISAIGNGVITLNSPLNFGHAVGDPIASTSSSNVVYQDLEMPQQICQDALNNIRPWRVARFGIASAPALTTGQESFATGLSPSGNLISAAPKATFYGRPLVAWLPALSADTYEVEWSKKAYPFTAEGSIMTPATSAILPLTVGTWYYRVRGFDYNLPTGAQMLSWSDTEQLELAPPTFKVTAVKAAKKTTFRVVPSKKSSKAVPSKKSSARRTLVLRFTVANVSSTQKDLPPNGASVGDSTIINYQLKNVAAQLGRSVGAVVGSGRDTITLTSSSAGTIDIVVALPGGTLRFSGTGSTANPATSFAVTGGTGSFSGASGTFTSTKTVITYTLSLPGT
jgi:hypothetical protein